MNFTIGSDQWKRAFVPTAVQGWRWKRTLDVLLILAAMPFLIPLALGITLRIRLVSRGPVLFKQERVGHLGRRFY